MSTNTLPIVGMFYRPPAQAIVNVLAIGTSLMLRAEPDNPADPNAVAVWIKTKDIPDAAYDALEESLPAYGHSLDTLQDQEEWHLGYVPKNFAQQLRATDTVPLDQPIAVTFAVNASGAPRVRFEQEVL